jgi:hypothetical protein
MHVFVGGMPAKGDVSTGHVMHVTELNGLDDVLVGARHVGRAAEHHCQQDETADEGENAEKTDLRKSVGAAMENLRHRMLKSERAREADSGCETRHRGTRRLRGDCPSDQSRLVPCCEKWIKQRRVAVSIHTTARSYAQTSPYIYW